MERTTDRLPGEVLLVVPVTWQIIGFTLFAIVCIALAFTAMASYSRVESVKGTITLDSGVASLAAPKAGIVSSVLVREGQSVAAGTALVNIRVETDLLIGGSMSSQVARSIAQQEAELAAQGNFVLVAAGAERDRLLAQMKGMERELAGFDERVRAQERLLEVATQELKEAQAVAARGFISRRDVNVREAAVLTRGQELAQLRQSRAARLAEYAASTNAITQSTASAQAQVAALGSSRSALTQQSSIAEAAKGYTITAPVQGTVAALLARPGQPAVPERPLLVIMPSAARAEVELDVPSNAAGFLEPGQEVRLAVDAFPYQRFGTVLARIVSVSSVTIPRPDSSGTIVPVYLVRARLDRPFVTAFGRRQPLLPGMTLSARIVTDRRTLVQWLFEPLFAVGRR
jgi:membrane fusion protein